MIKSDRDRLEDELDELDRYLSAHDTWTVEYSRKFIRRETVRKLIKLLGKKDWFNNDN